ncbi:MAG: GDP-mannose 4,6-dehydratase [Melioribacteraceae bacterium]|nr:GDP-mannose 4,6-dehydratase [Melioribacteraceae bacterium]MDD3559487.1 GDP-mannose 4,6-dehydratase [Melioribacteraceae bacterium]
MKKYNTQLEWCGKAENEVGIVKSINKDEFHAILTAEGLPKEVMRPVLRPVLRSCFSNEGGSRFQDEGGSCNHSISDADELLNSYSLLLNSEIVAIDPNYYRPTEADLLIGDPSKAKTKIDWQAETKIEELVEILVESDFKKVLEKGY